MRTSESLLASLRSNFGIDSEDPTAGAGGSPLLSPAGIAGIVLAVVVALLGIAALIGEPGPMSPEWNSLAFAFWQVC